MELYPFNVVVNWIRPLVKPSKCLFCTNPASYDNQQYLPDAMYLIRTGGGVYDINLEYDKAIRKQAKGDFSCTYPQSLCREHTIHFAAIQLGVREPVERLITLAALAKEQKGADISQALIVRVFSYEDEGDNYILSVENKLSKLIEEVTSFSPPE